ncbi:hypothetical protein [Amycolatopsis thermoflava]|uniref:hypothetical protein n=1 Tax=Amycolatopsis thermoflava TaxID=84480 RepID=UPI003EBE9377
MKAPAPGPTLLGRFDDVRVVDGVEGPASVAVGGDDAGQTQFGQVLSRGRDADADSFREGAHVVRTVCDQPYEVQPGRAGMLVGSLPLAYLAGGGGAACTWTTDTP